MKVICFVFAVFSLVARVTSTKVQVNQGWLRGEVMESVDRKCTYHSFKGIPYATPPVGNLRFKDPEGPLPWCGIRDATKHCSVCTQHNLLAESPSERHIGEEDCLCLNVYSPNITPKTSLPVLVFIHGGGFSFGSGNVDNYGADFLVCEDIVVVTINYRLGALGFLCMDTNDVPGNAGLKDQVTALEWVHENIRYFGGDPERVTIMGQSAGSTSVGYHLLSPMSAGLFQRAALMSGVPMGDFATPFESKTRAFELGKQLGCITNDTDKLLRCLQSVPSDKFRHIYNDFFPAVINIENIWKNDIIRTHVFTPVVEQAGNNSFLRRTHNHDTDVKAVNRAPLNKADILIGYTDQETNFIVNEDYLNLYSKYPELLVPKRVYLAAKPAEIVKLRELIHNHYFGDRPINVEIIKEFVNYCGDVNFKVPARSFVNNLQCGSQAYFYKFSIVSKRNYYSQPAAKYGLHGAAHCDDTLYTFDAKGLNMTIVEDSREYHLVQMVTTLFANFIKYGNPTPNDTCGVIWPLYDQDNKMYVDINDELTVRRDPSGAAFKFWNEIYESFLDL